MDDHVPLDPHATSGISVSPMKTIRRPGDARGARRKAKKALGKPERAQERKVGEVARLARVTVRTLHHYHEIGLLVPSGRSDAGYRRYSEEDLKRLHQIMLFRELDFPL